jgi:hypothetical protein
VAGNLVFCSRKTTILYQGAILKEVFNAILDVPAVGVNEEFLTQVLRDVREVGFFDDLIEVDNIDKFDLRKIRTITVLFLNVTSDLSPKFFDSSFTLFSFLVFCKKHRIFSRPP